MKNYEIVIVTLVLLATMFLPMFLIHFFSVSLELGKEAPGEVTVGLIVILRVTARRLLRGLSFNIMQTTIGTFGRTSARTVTRRIVKFVGRILFGSIMQDHLENSDEGNKSGKKPKEPSIWLQLFSIALGFVGLCLSFWGILHVIPPEQAESLVGSRGLSEFEAVVLAAVPLLAYAFLHWLFGKKFGVNTTYCTEVDGLLLQGYFTGAGSFLPMTTDVEYHGEKEANCKLAVSALLGMFLLFIIFFVAGVVLNMASLNFLGSMFLVYCFVYSFPIEPLEGHIIWSQRKLLWVAVAAPILLAFMNCLDSAFGDIL